MADFGSNGLLPGALLEPGADRRRSHQARRLGARASTSTSAEAGSINGYANLDGTSQATPFVSGVALLMLDANPALTPADIRTKITTTAIDWARGGNNKTVGTTGQDIDYGYGRLDAYAAIQSAGAPLTAPPFGPVHEFHQGTLSGTGAQVDYALDINDTTFPIAATMIMPVHQRRHLVEPGLRPVPVRSRAAAEVASSEFSTRQEELGYKPPVPGTYTLRVKSFNGSGGYFVDISRPQAPPPYPRPGSATPLRIPLVPAYCGLHDADDRVHALPLALPSCTPVVLQSSLLTMSRTGTRERATSASSALPGNPSTAADEADLHIEASATDVRRIADGTDYDGQVLLRDAAADHRPLERVLRQRGRQRRPTPPSRFRSAASRRPPRPSAARAPSRRARTRSCPGSPRRASAP